MTNQSFRLLDKLSIAEIKRDSKLSIGLDFLRAIATIEVLVGHLRNLYFVDYNQISIQTNLFVKFFYFITGFGHQAVIGFFVLSGLLIGNSVFKTLQQHKFTWKSYLIARLSRLWIVLIPALLLGLTWDLAGNFLSQGESIVYSGHLGTNIIVQPVVNSISPSIFLGNVFFLQNIYFPTLGSNAALWSLSHELWYYITFPVMMLVVINLQRFNQCLIYTVVFLFLLFGMKLRSDEGFLIWLLGSLVLLIFPNRKLPQQYQLYFLLLAYSLVIMTLIAIRINVLNSHSDLILGIVVSILILVMSFQQEKGNKNVISIISLWISNFSYTIYLTHLPFLIFILSLIIKDERWQPDTQHFCYILILLLITLLYARIVYLLTEKNTPRIRNYLKIALSRTR
ncbi:MAG: acyltransferase family protein [Nostoc sp. DedVER02]|uniref:acyltransferase family protein n=1 Tax=unclassified Nostoc TaxID=2593658 RepID=UPI002AD34A78|nr:MULTISPECIES: acyltransferase [unclassified Nostoc]MDZ7987996.1 acyltransferase [Nostoc sp. DedVER02]MDZ8114921.1 acyltransferase [Nostoc sp. DedVER01b]